VLKLQQDLPEAAQPLAEPAAAPVLAAAVSSMMAADVLVVPRERGNHLGTVELTDSCTFEVHVGAGIDMMSRGRAMRRGARYNKSQKKVLFRERPITPMAPRPQHASYHSCPPMLTTSP